MTGSAPVVRSGEAIEARYHTTVIAVMEPERLRIGPAVPPDELSLKIWKGETDVTDVLSHNRFPVSVGVEQASLVPVIAGVAAGNVLAAS